MIRFLFSLFIPLFVVSCGTDSGSAGGANFAAPSGNITQAIAAANKSSLGALATVSFDKPSSVPTSRDGELDSCTTKDPLTATDADNDGIKTQTRTYNCANVTVGTAKVSLTGKAIVVDEDDSNPKSGYSFTFQSIVGNYVGTSGAEAYTYNGNYKFHKDLTTGVFTYSGDYKATSTNTTTSGSSSTYVSGGVWNHVVTPLDAAHPDYSGAILLAGLHAATFNDGGTPVPYVFKVSSSGILYDHTCTRFYKQGSVTLEDGSENKVVITYTCAGAPTFTYNGTAI